MNAEQKFKLAKATIIATALVIATVLTVSMVLEHNPKTLSTSMDIRNQKVEMSCTFADENNEE